mgnify:CR=1 FL=1
MLLITPHLLQNAVHMCHTPCKYFKVAKNAHFHLFYSGFSFKLICKPTDVLQPFKKQLIATSDNHHVYMFTYEDFLEFYRSFPLYGILVRNFQKEEVIDDLHKQIQVEEGYADFVKTCQHVPEKKSDKLIVWDLWYAQKYGVMWKPDVAYGA